MTAQVQRRGKRRSVLHVVAGLLLASALVRFATEAGPALAQVTQSGPDEIQTAVPRQDNEATFLAALQARESQLSTR